MIRRRRSRADEVSFQITPMIDLTFLLLIFFMVTQRITEQQVMVPVDLPTSARAGDPSATEREIVNIDADGNYFIGDRPATEEELKAHLTEKFVNFPPLQIYVRADAMTPARKIKRVVTLAAEVGAIDLIYGVHSD